LIDFDKEIEDIIDASDNLKEIKIIRDKIAEGKEIVIFGAGNCGHAVYDFLTDKNIKVSAFCDNILTGIDNKTSLPIINVIQMNMHRNKYFVLISVADNPVFKVIDNQLKSMGFGDNQCLCMMNYIEIVSISFLLENRQYYQMVFDMLEDEYSKKTYIERIKRVYTLSNISNVMQPEENQYFDEELKLTDHEVFVDCGAYIGDTAMEFIKRVDGRYSQIYMFEAEKSKADQIKSNLKEAKYKLYPFGVWSENGKLCFNAEGSSASKISMEGEDGIEIDVVALDSVHFDEVPTFVKMDIEGSEKEALMGAKNIISDYCPKLAICIYHKREDLYELPLLIKTLNPRYKLYIRHYSNHFAETVCYAL